jgi:hypothetical protein
MAIIAALVLGLLLAVSVILIPSLAGPEPAPPAQTTTPTADNRPVPLVPVSAPAAGGPECTALLTALPADLTSGSGTLPRRAIADPAPLGALAWGPGRDPVVLRCGMERPAELTPISELLDVSGVRWLEIKGDDAKSTWYTVDRSIYVALTIPDGSGSGPIQDVSAVIRTVLPPAKIDTGN